VQLTPVQGLNDTEPQISSTWKSDLDTSRSFAAMGYGRAGGAYASTESRGRSGCRALRWLRISASQDWKQASISAMHANRWIEHSAGMKGCLVIQQPMAHGLAEQILFS
jgi:hypothetical protein